MTTLYINSVELKGFVGADAQPKQIEGGKSVLNFSLATSRFSGKGDDRKSFTTWHKIAAWGKLASELRKGDYLHVSGELRQTEYSTDAGKVQGYEIVARKIERLEKPAKQEAAA